ncbi:MAG TPA: threonine-phosphate decarboxylase CobD [Xanthobacteraceae bacterium]|nr:threonine-phosphate decarboxylase CobD [Xanthobacteraceae bacterium]
MARRASATDIATYKAASEALRRAVASDAGQGIGVEHGGDLNAARTMFPGAPEPFLDLSTGINPTSYPLPSLSVDVFARLPDSAAFAKLATAAAAAYGVHSAAHVVPAPGTQILLSVIAGLAPRGRAVVLTPTYAEHARAARRAGHNVEETSDIAALGDADLAILTNPNNPDGRRFAKDELIAVAKKLAARGGLLLVDEAFMDVGPVQASLAGEVPRGNIVVLRSFGKFFGLAGLRLGFAIAAPSFAERIESLLGPWAVSGPALAVGAQALADRTWIEATRAQLAQAANRLDALLTTSGLDMVGGTTLFRLVRSRTATELFHHLGRAGIFVRKFPDHPEWLRFGLPAAEPHWQRLQEAMSAFAGNSPAAVTSKRGLVRENVRADQKVENSAGAAAPSMSFDGAFRTRLRDLLAWRRDVRRFLRDPLPAGALEQLIDCACLAPSVGLSQPWRLVMVDDPARRAAIRGNFASCNAQALAAQAPERASLYAKLKLAGLEEAPAHFAVFADRSTEQGHGLGRHTMPEMIDYSVVTAVHTIWLAARAQGVGMGWVSILDPKAVSDILDVPGDWKFIGYFCLGYPQADDKVPELERAGWEYRRLPPSTVIRR